MLLKLIFIFMNAILLLTINTIEQIEAEAAVPSPVPTQMNLIGKISDINVNVSLYEHEILQFEVSWKDNLPNDTMYNIVVSPLNATLCPEMPCSIYGRTKSEKSIFLPENPMINVDERDCGYMYGCNYSLKVETSNMKTSLEKFVAVPSCVMEKCLCQHSVTLPTVIVNATIPKSDAIIFNWSFQLKENEKNQQVSEILAQMKKSKIYLQISKQSNPLLSWGGKLIPIIGDVYPLDTLTDTLQGEMVLDLKEQLPPKAVLSLQAYIVDELGCAGNQTITKITVPDLVLNNHGWRTVLIVAVSTFAVGIALTFSYCLWRRRREKIFNDFKKNEKFLAPFTAVVEMQDNINYVDKDIEEAQAKNLADIFEVPHSSIHLGSEIGEGAFGRVYKAIAVNLRRMRGNTVVAVKQLRRNPSADEIVEFRREIEMLKGVGTHHNIVCFLGCCTIRQPYLIIMEFVGRGDLLTYLRTVRHENAKFKPRHSNYMQCKAVPPKPTVKYIELKPVTYSLESIPDATEQPTRQQKPSVAETTYTIIDDEEFQEPFEYVLDHRELHNFALQIANGMRFLEEQEIIHRDLAARNVLIDDRKTLKISDFGLSRHGIYTNTKARKLPLRWLSIEAICQNFYSSKSDVWAYGVVLWEIGTLGASPYPNISNRELLPFLIAGKRLDKPDICTDQVYSIMLQCWDEDANNRPSFEQLYNALSPKTAYVDVSSLSDDYVFPPIKDN